jgi:L-cysteine desulfidase
LLDPERLFNTILAPALGCTEPVAVALAVAAATQAASGWTPEQADAPIRKIDVSAVKSVRLTVSRNIFKNAFGVAIPNANGQKGIAIAAALGVFCDPSAGLSLFSGLGEQQLAAAKRLVSTEVVRAEVHPKIKADLYIGAAVALDEGRGQELGGCVIRHEHTNISSLSRGDQRIFSRNRNGNGRSRPDMGKLKEMDLRHLVATVEELPESVLATIRKTVEMNTGACQVGLARPLGLGAGHYCAGSEQTEDVFHLISRMCAAGSDARMSGYPVEVMSCAGSGNQGIIATIPVVLYARHRGVDEPRMLRAVALSSLLTMYFTQHVGYLSALCGVAIKAGIGAACGIVYALGGGTDEIGRAIKIMTATLTGMICDGAKAGCALKVGIAADMAIRAAVLAMNRVEVQDDNGIVGLTAEETVRNLSALSRSMDAVDRKILEIMKLKMTRGQ